MHIPHRKIADILVKKIDYKYWRGGNVKNCLKLMSKENKAGGES